MKEYMKETKDLLLYIQYASCEQQALAAEVLW